MAHRTGLWHHFHGCSLWFCETDRRHRCPDNVLNWTHSWNTAARLVEKHSQVCRTTTTTTTTKIPCSSAELWKACWIANWKSVWSSPFQKNTQGHQRWSGGSILDILVAAWPWYSNYIVSIRFWCNLQAQVVVSGGSCVSELSAHRLCLSSSKPTSATDGPPLSIAVHLHPPLRGISSSHQPNPQLKWYIRKTRRVCKEI